MSTVKKNKVDAIKIAKFLRKKVGKGNAVTESMVIAGCWCYEFASEEWEKKIREIIKDTVYTAYYTDLSDDCSMESCLEQLYKKYKLSKESDE